MAALEKGVLRPNGSLTTIEYTVCLAGGGRELDRCDSLTIKHGEKMVHPEIDHAVRKLGVEIDQFAYKEVDVNMTAGEAIGAARCDRLKVDRKAAAVVHVRLIDTPEGGGGASVSVLMDKATKLKQDGNELFKEKLYADALIRYKKAGRILRKARFAASSTGVGKARDDTKAMRVAVLLNSAACHLNNAEDRDPKAAIAACTKVLSLDADNVKALFRRAQGLSMQGKSDEAESDLMRALTIDPSNAEVKRERERLRVDAQKERAREGKMYAKMFS